MSKIIIFGCGECGRRAHKHYVEREVEIIAFSDNNPDLHHKSLLGIRIIKPTEIIRTNFDKVIIASTFYSEIKKNLINIIGIPKEKIDIVSTNIAKGNIEIGSENRKKTALHALIDITKILKNANISYTADHGTLLGIYRDNDLMEWDNDVDICIPYTEMSKAIEQISKNFLITKKEWDIYTLDGEININSLKNITAERIIKVTNKKKEKNENIHITVDIILKHEVGQHLYWLAGKTTLKCHKSALEDRRAVSFKGEEIHIPNQTEEYLELLYGDWRKKVKCWNHSMYKNSM